MNAGLLVVLALVSCEQQEALPELIPRKGVQGHIGKVAPQHSHRAKLQQRRQSCRNQHQS